MNATNTEVLIVGAGPSGLVLACDLHRRGVRTRIVEARATAVDATWGARGKGIQPRTMEIYDDLGVVEEVYALGSSFFPAMEWDGRRPLGEARLPRVEPRLPSFEAPHSSTWMLTQPEALHILESRLAELGGTVEYGMEAVSFSQDDDGVEVVLRDEAGMQTLARCGYLVGGDGAHGMVRPCSGVEFLTSSVDSQPMLAADVIVDGLPRTHWHQWNRDERGALWLAPLPNSEFFQLYARYETDAPATTEASVRQLVLERTGYEVREVRQASSFGIRVGMADRFQIGRAFLMGDAAHVHPPAGAQGMNASVQDAYNLGWKLGAVLRHGAPSQLLETYEGERLPVATNLLAFVQEVYKKWIGRNQQYTAADERGDNLQLSLNYRGGPLAAPTASASDGLESGDRVPDAQLRTATGAPVRLFDLMRGPHFTLLAVGEGELPDWSGLRDQTGMLRGYRLVRSGRLEAGPGDIRDPYGFPSKRFGQGLTLIRPDGYLALAGVGHREILEYLSHCCNTGALGVG